MAHSVSHWGVLWAQSCSTLGDPMDRSPPGSSAHGILQARTLGWVAMPFSRGSSQSRDRTEVSSMEGIFFSTKTSQVAQMVKNLPAVWETWVRSLAWEDALEKGMATHSSILAWRIPWTEEPGGLQTMGSQRVGHD